MRNFKEIFIIHYIQFRFCDKQKFKFNYISFIFKK